MISKYMLIIIMIIKIKKISNKLLKIVNKIKTHFN